jgi:flagellar hook-associated protein 1 FlgK
MSSTFAGLSSALSALTAQRIGLDVAAQNIANVNTEGYTRQRVGMSAVAGVAPYPGWAGGGVSVDEVARLRDALVDARNRTEHAGSGYLDTRQATFDQLEQLIAEPSDTGLQAKLADFWSSWHDVANNPGDLPARTQLLGRAQTVAIGLRGSRAGVDAMWSAGRGSLNALVSDVNATAASVAELNRSVVQAQLSGTPGNELADQRDRLVLHLAELTGATATRRASGAVDVSLGGSTLVSGAAVRQLRAAGAVHPADAAAQPVSVQWADGSAEANVPSGRLAATLEALGSTLPAQAAALDAVAAQLADTVNTGHAAGYDLSGAPGGAFFTGSTADTIAVAVTDPAAVAAASTPGGTLDGGNADLLAGLAAVPGGADGVYRQFVAELATAVQGVRQRSAAQAVSSSAAEAAVTAQSGVSLDEEMTTMLTFERAYQAASRVLTTMDSVLDTLINHTGIG